MAEDDKKKIGLARLRASCGWGKVQKDLDYCVQRDGMEAIRKAIFSENRYEHLMSLSADHPRKVSYAAKPIHKHDSERRTKVTLYRYITKWFPEMVEGISMGESQMEAFVARFWASLLNGQDLESMFKVISGQDIVRTFRNEVGGRSCMTGDGSKFTQVYADNPDKVQMLIFDDGNMKARAVMWKIGDTTLVDRVYPNGGYHLDPIAKYCAEQGWIQRSNNHLPDYSPVPFDDGKIYDILLDRSKTDYMPFLDSFHWGFKREDSFTLSNERARGCDLKFDSQHGRYSGGHRCECCGESILDGEEYRDPNGDYWCDCCWCDNWSSCDNCDGNVHTDDTCAVESCDGGMLYVCEYCRDDISVYCDSCGENRPNDETQTVVVNTHGSEETVCDNCMEDITACSGCSEYHRNDLLTRPCPGCDNQYCNPCVEAQA